MYDKLQAMKKKAGAKDKNLRRKIEVLRAQISSSKDIYIPKVESTQKAQTKNINTNEHSSALKTDTTLIKKDLFKTILLSLLAFSIIFTLKIA